ncbi:MAG: protein translocase subunit SecD [Candidatus Caenarcaniphilales bacterium]|nr:protein translocase subunit SecD [Candidatus Caenarcaniphilales bacterium]
MKQFNSILILTVIGLSAFWLFGGRADSNSPANLKLGLDLVGGAQLTFKAMPEGEVKQITPEVMQGLLEVIENRVNASGTSEVTVQKVGADRVLVEIPGVNPDLVKRRLLKTAKLEFKELSRDYLAKQAEGKAPPAPDWVETGITGADLKRAQVGTDPSGNWIVAFEFKPKGGQKFAELTGRLSQKKLPLAIFLDDALISAPVVNSQIRDNGQIEGGFSPEEARDLAVQLNAGALPVPVKLISERTVGATLGQASIDQSLQAGLIGLGLIALFMTLVYRLPGFLASLALIGYTLISLGIFTRGITLTLAGIAGFILSIGMAVDANILIFERIREELRIGRTIYRAVEEGFKRAFPSIFDSNLNTLIVCLILGVMGTGLVRGFAITLAVGVIVSFFSAILITRELVNLSLQVEFLRKPGFYGVPDAAAGRVS